MKKKCTVILLAAGAGRRMGSEVEKQYMMLCEKPVIWYGLQAFQQSLLIDDIILVTGKEEVEYVRKDIVEKYGFSKVSDIVCGGAERYLSVQNALRVLQSREKLGTDGYIFIHDGARPLVTEKIITDTYEAVQKYNACCAAVLVKDTIKIVDDEGFVIDTPDRKHLYAVQTPQVFRADLILEAYCQLSAKEEKLKEQNLQITDDAMVVETMLQYPVKMVEASYENIKITTPEDMVIATRFLSER